MIESTVLLEKICPQCSQSGYIARYYAQPIPLDLPFDLLPDYIGTSNISVKVDKVHMKALSMPGGVFTDRHYLDVFLRIKHAEPQAKVIFWERHKGGTLVNIEKDIDKTIRVLAKKLKLDRT